MHLFNHHRRPSIFLYLVNEWESDYNIRLSPHARSDHARGTYPWGGDACSPLPVSGSLYNDVVCTERDIKGGEHDFVDDRDVGRAGALDGR
jgi:hypothetical protein